MPVGPNGEPIPYTQVNLPPPGPSPAPAVTLPQGGNPGITSGPQGGGPPVSMHGNEPSIIPLPGGGVLMLPQRPLTPEEQMVLGGVRAGNPVGGPAAQAILDSLIAEGVVTPGSDPSAAPIYRFNAPPPGGGPQPAPGPPVYTQNRVTQEQFNQQMAAGQATRESMFGPGAGGPMSTAQRWARFNQAQNPSPQGNDPNTPPVEPTPAPSFPYEPPPVWGPSGGGQSPADEIIASQGQKPGTVIPRPPGPGQTLPGPKSGSPPFYPGPQPGGSPPFYPGGSGSKPADIKSQRQKPPAGSPPFNPNPQATHANTLRTFLG